MPPDPFQIALEHHRYGRLIAARDGYRAAIAADPAHADAMHWLGVLFCQAGRAREALPLLERAVALRPSDPVFHHNLAQAYLALGRGNDAIAALERADALDPNRAQTLTALALAHLARKAPGDAGAAIDLLRRAQAAGDHSPEGFHHLAVACLNAGKFDDAIAAAQSAVEKKCDYASAFLRLGLAQRCKGKIEEARQSLARAAELDPDFIRAWQALGMLEAQEGRYEQAAGHFRKAVDVRPDAATCQHLAQALRAAGKPSDAARAAALAAQISQGTRPHIPTASARAVAELERKLAPSPDADQLHFAMAAVLNVAPPAQVPPQVVVNLFEKYADRFDEHLRDTLQYRAPEMIVAAIQAAHPPIPLDILDLGCGTGLCGPLLRPLARTLVGVDLSPAMLEKARARQIYDRLELIDLVAALRAAPRGFDLLVAADVLIYFGDLSPLIEAAKACLRPGGLFAFTLEAAEGDRFEMRHPSLRFAHSRHYIQILAKMHGMAEVSFADVTVRMNADQPVAGYLLVLRAG
ncbi:MAG TPA: tetratricopeptide repeat protein [Tepidisphaeraceae bacterium]|nr:tetratricopeptide repeat protein [Tepidisphaeraceae bacterium]